MTTTKKPWGSYTVISDKPNVYKLKRLDVLPGKELSLQYHHKRSETWAVISGQGQLQIGDTIYSIGPDECYYIPRGALHQLRNTGTEDMSIIEIQIGVCDEEDIVRIPTNEIPSDMTDIPEEDEL